MPWSDNPAWDAAIEAAPSIVITGAFTEERPPRPSTAVLHRPNDLLVDQRELKRSFVGPRLRRILASVDAAPADDARAAVAASLGLVLYRVPGDGRGLPDLARRLREVAPRAAGVNTVMVAGPQRHGGDSPPTQANPPTDIPGAGTDGDNITIAVLDTGILDPAPFEITATAHDVDPVTEWPPGRLAPAVAHGTFVAGIVRRHAPGARIVARKVLTGAEGSADELMVAAALDGLPDVDIVNMSFGGLAVDDATMLALERAVNRLPRSTLLVACAGNNGLVRPYFPAAFKRVVAVGAVERRGGRWARASFSNFGPWVDACSDGTDVHSGFVTFTETGPGGQAFTGGATWSGTSFAAPRVSAAAAVQAAGQPSAVRLEAHRLLTRGPMVRDLGRVIA